MTTQDQKQLMEEAEKFLLSLGFVKDGNTDQKKYVFTSSMDKELHAEVTLCDTDDDDPQIILSTCRYFTKNGSIDGDHYRIDIRGIFVSNIDQVKFCIINSGWRELIPDPDSVYPLL